MKSQCAEDVSGRLRIRFDLRSGGLTALVERFRTGLFHLGKPYWDGEQLVLQVINPTAGIFENDSLDSRITAEEGSRACVLSPSSLQVYAMPNGDLARSHQQILVKPEAGLSVIPRWTVLHKGARFRQNTLVDLHEGCRLIYVDPISSGRYGFGEYLEYSEYDSRTTITENGKLLLKERFCCGRDFNRWIWKTGGRLNTHFVTIYLYFPGCANYCEEHLQEPLRDIKDVSAGLTCLNDNFCVFRVISRGSMKLESCLKFILQSVREQVPVSSVVNRIL